LQSLLGVWKFLLDACDTDLVMMRLFPYQITNSEYLEDFELNGIPVKAVTLHNSDFCQQNAANQNTNT
jgi:hypothetical protein